MLRWNRGIIHYMFRILLPNCHPWKPIQILKYPSSLLKLNTGLPPSAAVERPSVGGRVFSPLRCSLSSEHLEMMFLHTTAKWRDFCYTCG